MYLFASLQAEGLMPKSHWLAEYNLIYNKAVAMMRSKSPPSEIKMLCQS